MAATPIQPYRHGVFDVSADAYARFMGRYSRPLADLTVDLAGVRAGQRALDVGCGPGIVTAPLCARLGQDGVAAVDPSAAFVDAVRQNFPAVDARQAVAESLPFEDDHFDVTVAQLVVHFMADPVQGLREMARVTAPAGTVVASVWDLAESGGPVGAFWAAARAQSASVTGEAIRPGVRRGDLAQLFWRAGMPEPLDTQLTVQMSHESFEEYWQPFTLGVGPAGAYYHSLPEDQRADLRERCRALLPDGSFTIHAKAWTCLWRKPSR